MKKLRAFRKTNSEQEKFDKYKKYLTTRNILKSILEKFKKDCEKFQ